MEDRVVLRDGEMVRMTHAELEGLMESAFNTACWTALRQLGVENGNDIESIGADGQFGNDRITVCVKLRDGQEATATALLWSDATQAS